MVDNFIKNNYILCPFCKKYKDNSVFIVLWNTLKRSLKLLYCNNNN
jgi:hypothetical protein